MASKSVLLKVSLEHVATWKETTSVGKVCERSTSFSPRNVSVK